MDITKLLTELNNTNLLRITGSFADGTQRIGSDIDFYIKPDKFDTPRDKRNILLIIAILEKYKIKLNSVCTGCLSTIGENNNIPVELEFSNFYNKRKNKLKEVVIYGITY